MVLLYYEHDSNVRLSDRRPMKKRSKKLPKTLAKRRPNPTEIDTENNVFFRFRFFLVSALILEGFHAPTWKQVGRFTP